VAHSIKSSVSTEVNVFKVVAYIETLKPDWLIQFVYSIAFQVFKMFNGIYEEVKSKIGT
jgi:hypothetical protein